MFICLRPASILWSHTLPPPPNTLYTCIVYTILYTLRHLFTPWRGGGEGGRDEPERRLDGQQFRKLGHMTKCISNRVQWFWLFFKFWGITTHPWHPKGPRIWKLAQKNFQLHARPAEIFGKNRKMLFFGMISKFNFRSPVWQIFTIFSACFINEILNTHIKF